MDIALTAAATPKRSNRIARPTLSAAQDILPMDSGITAEAGGVSLSSPARMEAMAQGRSTAAGSEFRLTFPCRNGDPSREPDWRNP